jgi:hypothetical protein
MASSVLSLTTVPGRLMVWKVNSSIPEGFIPSSGHKLSLIELVSLVSPQLYPQCSQFTMLHTGNATSIWNVSWCKPLKCKQVADSCTALQVLFDSSISIYLRVCQLLSLQAPQLWGCLRSCSKQINGHIWHYWVTVHFLEVIPYWERIQEHIQYFHTGFIAPHPGLSLHNCDFIKNFASVFFMLQWIGQ